MEHDDVNQAAAVGVPDDTTGTAVVLYVINEDGVAETDELRKGNYRNGRRGTGQTVPAARSAFHRRVPQDPVGKIIRRAVQAIHVGEDLGDLSSIENPKALDAVENAR